jgi:FkbM family methyltransferase
MRKPTNQLRINLIAQAVYSVAGRLTRQRGQYFKLAAWKLAHSVAGLFSRRNDVIQVTWYGASLLAPVTSQLISFRSKGPDYDKSLALMVAAIGRKYPGAPMIDIGANIGDTAVMMRDQSPHSPILCIEASENMYPILRHNVRGLKELTCINAFIGQHTGTIAGELREGKGTAGFNHSTGSVQMQSLEDILTSRPEFRAARLLKVDTDGFDSQIITGALGWLAIQRPVLFWECDPAADASANGRGLQLFHDLTTIGYEAYVFFANSGEIMCACRADDRAMIQDLYRFLLRRSHMPYADVCAFGHEDFDLIRASGSSLEYLPARCDATQSLETPRT